MSSRRVAFVLAIGLALGFLFNDSSASAHSSDALAVAHVETSAPADDGNDGNDGDDGDDGDDGLFAVERDDSSVPVGVMIGIAALVAVFLFGLNAIRKQRQDGPRRRFPPIG